MGSTSLIADNIRNWKEAAPGVSHRSETEPASIAAPLQPQP
jgi:hypothetical protein